MPAALFIVRATVTDASRRAAFDKWYETEHLPDAMKSFGVKQAWRFWCADDPALHLAMYRFDDQASLERATTGAEMQRLITDFNRDWPQVTRTRETLLMAQEAMA